MNNSPLEVLSSKGLFLTIDQFSYTFLSLFYIRYCDILVPLLGRVASVSAVQHE